MARNPSMTTLNGIWARLIKIAQGAELMTETKLDVKIISSDSNIVGNDVLAAVAQKNLEEVGGYSLNEEQIKFAVNLQKSLSQEDVKNINTTNAIQPLRPVDPNAPSASTDVGDVSWTVPTIGFVTATFVPGVSAHTWQAAASAGMSIGQDGMVVASKALALMAVDLFKGPALVEKARTEFETQTNGKKYESAIPANQKPLLDYREN
jgi:aminobenzoyl-glutamate utilization protein B